jgi:hypothetical protein
MVKIKKNERLFFFSTRIKIGECSLSQKKRKKKRERDKCQKPTKRQIDKEQKTGFVFVLKKYASCFSIEYMYKRKRK